MNTSIFRKMDATGRDYWWYRGKEALVDGLARQSGIVSGGRVLDLGCGTGTLFEFLEGWGSVVGLELSADALVLARSRKDVPLVRASTDAIPFAPGSFSLVAIFDCLEHLGNDHTALVQVRDLVTSDGHVIISVPAFQFLRSRRDDQLAHMRRYSPAGLRHVVEDAGFEILRMTFGYFCLFAPLLVKSVLDRMRPPPTEETSDIADLKEPWNSMVAGWLRGEAWLATRAGLPLGTSLFCLARPRKDAS